MGCSSCNTLDKKKSGCKKSGSCSRCNKFSVFDWLGNIAPPNNKKVYDIKSIIKTKRGNACVEKVDIFKKIIWYSYVRSRQGWMQVSVGSVKKMIKLNQHGNCDFLIEDFLSPSKNIKTL